MHLIKLLITLSIFGALIATAFEWLDNDSLPPVYRTESITRGSISEVVTANGTINPVELVTVGTQVSGQVNHVYVKLNSHVKKGQLLADIDPSLLISQINQDQSSLDTALYTYQQAERDLKRSQMLLAKDYVAKVDLEHAEQTYQQAKNGYEAAKIIVARDEVNLNYAKITSPIDGVIISQDVTLGQTLASSFQTPSMFKIAGDLTRMKIDVSLSEADISKIKEGMPVTFSVTAFPDRQFSGTVQTVNLSPNTQQGVVMYSVSVLADNPDQSLLPGMTAYVSMTISEKKNVLRVSAAALRFIPPVKQASGMSRLFHPEIRPRSVMPAFNESDTTKTLYLLKNDQLVPVKVTTGATDDAFVEISGSGIAEGDKVVSGIKVTRNP